MSKVIQVLEAMAQMSNADIEQLIAKADITAEQAEAIIIKDVISLERQLDICPDIYCVFFPAEDETPEGEDEEEKDEEVQSVVNI